MYIPDVYGFNTNKEPFVCVCVCARATFVNPVFDPHCCHMLPSLGSLVVEVSPGHTTRLSNGLVVLKPSIE